MIKFTNIWNQKFNKLCMLSQQPSTKARRVRIRSRVSIFFKKILDSFFNLQLTEPRAGVVASNSKSIDKSQSWKIKGQKVIGFQRGKNTKKNMDLLVLRICSSKTSWSWIWRYKEKIQIIYFVFNLVYILLFKLLILELELD